jgi:hypothetical protein
MKFNGFDQAIRPIAQHHSIAVRVEYWEKTAYNFDRTVSL